MKKTLLTKNKLYLKLMALFWMLFISYNVQAQEGTISGIITDETGEGLPGVTVIIKGTTIGTVTGIDGDFRLAIRNNQDVLLVSFVGYETKEIVVGDQTSFNIKLNSDISELQEVVVIGYSRVQREKVLGATAMVKSDDIAKITPVNAFEAVQGRLPGVQILSNGGPGSGMDIRIRGVNTLSSGTSPLFVVDGQQLEDIDNIDPNDIATFEVLKDAATTAIYGSRGANGVVLITTKSAKAGSINIDVTSNYTISQLIGGVPISNTRQRIEYEDVRRGATTVLTLAQRDSLSLLSRNSFNLLDLITRAAVRRTVNVALSGGSEKMRAFWNLGIQDQEGIVVNSSYQRINSRLKIDYDPVDFISFGSNLNVSAEQLFGLNENQVFQQMVERIAYFPVFEPNGTFTPEIAGRQNPVAEAHLRRIEDRNYRIQSFSYAQIRFTNDLSFKSTIGLNYRYRDRENFEPVLTRNPNNPIPFGSLRHDLNYDIQQENFVNYEKKFQSHYISAFVGMQTQRYYRKGFGIAANFVSDAIETFNNSDPESLAINAEQTGASRNNLFSTFAGFNYDFKNKYLVSGTLRRDGSSRFGEDNKYGLFPSFSIGWRMSEEQFFVPVKNIVNNALFKYSYGESGNERIGDYDAVSRFAPGYVYAGFSGVAPITLGNPQIGWENTNSSNIGLSLGFLKSRVNLDLEIWQSTTEALLANVPLPEETGYASIRSNVGSVENNGIDLNISADIIKGQGFTWSSSFNISTLKNEVKTLAGGTSFFSGDYLVEEGQPIGNINGYRNLGVYQYNESNAYTDDGTRLTPNFGDDGLLVSYTLNGQEYTGNVNQMQNAGQVLQGGDIIWEDTNNDFDITSEDRQTIGNGLPKYYGGFSHDFSYKGVSLSLLFDYSIGQDIWRRYDELRNDLNSSNETPGPDRIDGAWREPGDITVFPRLNRVPQNRERPNSFFVTKGDWIKLRVIRFSYSLPSQVIGNIGWLKKVDLNLSFNNLLTLTNYPGYNPELGTRGNPLQVGLDNLRYPNSRELVMGVRIQL